MLLVPFNQWKNLTSENRAKTASYYSSREQFKDWDKIEHVKLLSNRDFVSFLNRQSYPSAIICELANGLKIEGGRRSLCFYLIEKLKNLQSKVILYSKFEVADIVRLQHYSIDAIIQNDIRSDFDKAILEHLSNLKLYKNKLKKKTKILIKDCKIEAFVGLYSYEYAKPTKLSFDVEADVWIAQNPCNIADVFSYDIILDEIYKLEFVGHTELLETLAEKFCQKLKSHYQIDKISVTITKFGIVKNGSVSVQMNS